MLRLIPMSMLCALAFALLPTSGQAITRGNISYKSCSPSEVKEIDTALAWLKSHINQIDARMGKNNPANWPDRSRDKFIKKLDKILIFACIDHQTRCRREQDGLVRFKRNHGKTAFDGSILLLCTQDFSRGQVDYVSTMAHEISHRVHLNVDQRRCVDQCRSPGFSQSLALAARHVFEGTQYDPEACAAQCK